MTSKDDTTSAADIAYVANGTARLAERADRLAGDVEATCARMDKKLDEYLAMWGAAKARDEELRRERRRERLRQHGRSHESRALGLDRGR